MSFPFINCPLRTNISFRGRLQPSHHKEYRSIIEDLPIDMISCFPTSDPLHLLELGVMKKYIFLTQFLFVFYLIF